MDCRDAKVGARSSPTALIARFGLYNTGRGKKCRGLFTGRERSMSNFIFEELRDRFPKVFGVPEYQRQPLAIGIHEDIAAALGNYSAQEISEFLTYWTNSPFYLDNCRPGVDR